MLGTSTCPGVRGAAGLGFIETTGQRTLPVEQPARHGLIRPLPTGSRYRTTDYHNPDVWWILVVQRFMEKVWFWLLNLLLIEDSGPKIKNRSGLRVVSPE